MQFEDASLLDDYCTRAFYATPYMCVCVHDTTNASTARITARVYLPCSSMYHARRGDKESTFCHHSCVFNITIRNTDDTDYNSVRCLQYFSFFVGGVIH